MKKIFIVLFTLLFSYYNLFSQAQNWVPLNSGTDHWLRAVYFINQNTGFAVGDGGIILKTSNAGQNWTSQTWGSVSALYSISFKQNKGTIVGQNPLGGTIMKTSNLGENWTLTGYNYTGGLVTFNKVTYLDTNVYLIGGFYLSFSDYKYYTIFIKHYDWNDSNYRYNTNIVAQERSYCFSDANTVFSVGGPPGNIMTSHDGCMTWTNVQWTVPLNSVFFINSNTGFITGYGGKVYRTLTGGNSWTESTQGGSNTSVNSVFFVPQGSGYRGCIVGDGGLIKMTLNLGTNWITSYSMTGYTFSAIFFIDSLTGYVVGQNGIILKTTNGGAVTSFNMTGESVPQEFVLYQNYPNPFNPTTTIKFSIPHSSFVTLKVYDALGKEIETLLNEDMNAGTYESSFDGSQLSSGIYFYRIIAGDFQDVKKMVLIK